MGVSPPRPHGADRRGPGRSETYQYYNLPFCHPEEGVHHKPETLGEVVDGNRLVTSAYELDFRVDRDFAKLCTKKLTHDDLEKFRKVRRRVWVVDGGRSTARALPSLPLPEGGGAPAACPPGAHHPSPSAGRLLWRSCR